MQRLNLPAAEEEPGQKEGLSFLHLFSLPFQYTGQQTLKLILKCSGSFCPFVRCSLFSACHSIRTREISDSGCMILFSIHELQFSGFHQIGLHFLRSSRNLLFALPDGFFAISDTYSIIIC